MALARIIHPKSNLVDGYRGLRQKATDFLGNLVHLQSEQRKLSLPRSGVSSRVQTIIYRKELFRISVAERLSEMPSLVRVVLCYSEKAVDIVVADLEDHLQHMRGALCVELQTFRSS